LFRGIFDLWVKQLLKTMTYRLQLLQLGILLQQGHGRNCKAFP